MPRKPQQRKARGSRSWIDAHGTALLDDDGNGIFAVGLGKKSAGALNDDERFCVTAFVERKLTSSQLKACGRTAFASSFAAISEGRTPADLGMEIDVVETGTRFSAQPSRRVAVAQRGPYGGQPPSVDFQRRFDAIRIGVGITNPVSSYPQFLSTGTLGFFVTDSQDFLYLVSNNHVIANENDASVGDSVVQPGTLDLTETEFRLMNTLGRLENELQIAELSGWVDIAFADEDGTPLNEVDGALAAVLDGVRDLEEIDRVGFGGVLRGVAAPYSADEQTGALRGSTRVYKAGRTTGWTEGDVSALGVLVDVEYEAGVARFRDQIAVTPTSDNVGSFSDSGDSGSGVVNEQHELIGLLFAGSESRTLVNPIHAVLSALGDSLGEGPLTVVTG